WVALFSLLDIGNAGFVWRHVVICLGMAVALLFRRRWPLAVMAVVAGFALAQVLVFPKTADPRPYDVALLVAMYSVVKYGRRLAHGFLAAGVMAVGIAIEVLRHLTRNWWVLTIVYGASCAAVWLTAYTIRTRRSHMTALEERALTADRERDHLARL